MGRLTQEASVRAGGQPWHRWPPGALAPWRRPGPGQWRFPERSGQRQEGLHWQPRISTARWPVFLEDTTLTSAGFPVATWPVLPTADSPRFSSDLWCRCHHFSFCRCTVPFGSQGWCHLSGVLLQGIWGHPPPSLAGHQGLRTLWKLPSKLWWESRTTPYGTLSGQRQKLVILLRLTSRVTMNKSLKSSRYQVSLSVTWSQ